MIPPLHHHLMMAPTPVRPLMNEPRLIMTVQQVDMHCTAGRRREHYPIGIGTELGKGEGKTTLSLSSLGLARIVRE